MKKWAIISSIILIGLAAVVYWAVSGPVTDPAADNLESAIYGSTPEEDAAPEIVNDSNSVTNTPVPATPVDHAIKILAVPFTSQAPYANWDMPYQEACEEASIIMAVDFVLGRKDLQIPPAEADDRIVELVNWETANGYDIDINAAEVVKVLNDRFSVRAEVVPYSSEAIKKQINLGKPVIIPAAGQLLGNPNFRQPGPVYHMLVIKGYEGDEFITNDPGTRLGKNYRYHFSVIDRAVHDWNGGDVRNGQQVMVILK